MSDDIKKAKCIAKLLRSLAKEIESNPQLCSKFNIGPEKAHLQKKSPKKTTKNLPVISIFDIFTNAGKDGLENKLLTFDLPTLKSIVSQHRLDSSKLYERWKSKERLINLILSRVQDRMSKGDAFIEYK